MVSWALPRRVESSPAPALVEPPIGVIMLRLGFLKIELALFASSSRVAPDGPSSCYPTFGKAMLDWFRPGSDF